jgi:hypothetical protein
MHVLDLGVWENVVDLVMAALSRHEAAPQMQPLVDRALRRLQQASNAQKHPWPTPRAFRGVEDRRMARGAGSPSYARRRAGRTQRLGRAQRNRGPSHPPRARAAQAPGSV